MTRAVSSLRHGRSCNIPPRFGSRRDNVRRTDTQRNGVGCLGSLTGEYLNPSALPTRLRPAAHARRNHPKEAILIRVNVLGAETVSQRPESIDAIVPLVGN